MEHREIEHRQMVERYLAGRLARDEAAWFEEHYLSCQECLEQLELSEAFREGIHQAAAEDALKTTVAGRLAVMAWLARALSSPRGALLALAILAAAVLPLAFAAHRLGEAREKNAELAIELAEARSPQSNTVVLPLSPERSELGQAPAARIPLPAEPGWIVLSLELDRPEHASYRARLVSAGGDVLWTGEGLTPSHLDALTVSLHSSFLAEGDYLLSAEALLPDGRLTPAGRFAFRVLPPRP